MDRKTYEFISKQTNDPIVERRKCLRTGKDFPIFQGDIDLLKKVSPKIGGIQYDLSLPTLSFKERSRRRLMRRNDRKLYKTKDSFTKKQIITYYHPELETKITESDNRYKSIDNTSIGEYFDFSKSFGSQFRDLISKTVKQNTLKVGLMENSVYTHNAGGFKDCYMTFDGGNCEKVLYTTRVADAKDIVDGFEIFNSDNIYDSVSIINSSNLFYSRDCNGCSYGAFLYNCIGSTNCIACTGLVNKNYCIGNRQVTKEKFDETWQRLFSGDEKTISIVKNNYKKLLKTTVVKNINMTNSKNSIGHNLHDCKNVHMSLEAHNIEDCRYVSRMSTYGSVANNMDINSRGGNMQYCYDLNCSGADENTTTLNCQFGSYLFRGVANTQYSINIPSDSTNLFACSDLQGKSYCILNKQYTKQEYEDIMPKIIEHMKKYREWGEFLDPKYSPFPYNDTIANDYFPIKYLKYPNEEKILLNKNGKGVMLVKNKELIVSDAELDLGGEIRIRTKRRNKDYNIDIPDNLNLLDAANINKLSDEEILNSAIRCEESGRPYRIIKSEIEFYRKHGLALPKLHPDIRHKRRLSETINSLNLFVVNCDKCGKEILSVYSQDSDFKVYCQDCYNEEVY